MYPTDPDAGQAPMQAQSETDHHVDPVSATPIIDTFSGIPSIHAQAAETIIFLGPIDESSQLTNGTLLEADTEKKKNELTEDSTEDQGQLSVFTSHTILSAQPGSDHLAERITATPDFLQTPGDMSRRESYMTARTSFGTASLAPAPASVVNHLEAEREKTPSGTRSRSGTGQSEVGMSSPLGRTGSRLSNIANSPQQSSSPSFQPLQTTASKQSHISGTSPVQGRPHISNPIPIIGAPAVHHNFPEETKETKEKAQTTHGLRTWWKNFSSGQKSTPSVSGLAEAGKGGVFGVQLEKSLSYASVQISTTKADGGLYIWGYVPVVVAKCGLHLKDTATEVPGTFRVSGSAKRMKELQSVFDNPPKYGKNLDWKKTSYTTHDVATILRRYLTQMPEPIVPRELYHDFRSNLAKADVNLPEAIRTYQQLIAKMPKPSQYLLLYVLDLLSVFARKADKNLMTAPNLAVIFQPGIISHTDHEMAPAAHALSQKVLEFLIEHQDHFLLGMQLEPTQSHTLDTSQGAQDVPHIADPLMTTEEEVLPPVASPKIIPAFPPVSTLAKTESKSEPVVKEGSLPRHESITTTSSRPSVPRPPQPVRAETDMMIPSDSDDEAPEGGYYVKSEKKSRLNSDASVGRSRTVSEQRRIPIVEEYRDPEPFTSPYEPITTPRTGGLRATLTSRRGSRARALSNADRPKERERIKEERPPQIKIVDNPRLPTGGAHEVGSSGGAGLFRRRTAPARRNKEDEDVIRKRAERAVKLLGTGKAAPVEV